MKISPQWLREFVDLKVGHQRLADDLTMAGIGVESISGDGEATVFEVEITTNRVDAMNHYGVARECSAIYDLDLKPLKARLPDAQGSAGFAIEIADAQGCARYTAQIILGVTIQSSPKHITQRLEMMDARPINNAADATNYTLIEMGHPTHAFDLDLLQGGKIIVRRAREGEALKTLDGVERKLSSEDLVIADAERAVALAGVMGGFDTMITDQTRNILIESAWFDPISIRKTARRYGLHTDASHRFERGADWGATPLACARVAQLILESSGGTLRGGQIDAIARRIERSAIQLTRAEVARILGQEVPEADILRILRRLGFTVAPRGAAGFTIEIPTWRLDVERDIDIIEEIARVYGYNRFPNTLPAFSGAVVEPAEAHKDTALRAALLGLGYNEAISLTFFSHADAQAFSGSAAVEIENPLSEEAAVMRPSMVPGMLGMLAWNLNRGSSDVRLFEAGNVYELAGARTEERKQIVIGATGNAFPPGVHQPSRPYSFFDLKGDVEVLLGEFEFNSLYYDAHAADYYHPGRSARAVMDGATVARCGQLHPDVAAARKLRQEVYVAELYLDRLYRHSLRQPRYQAVPRFPAVARDFSFVFDSAVSFEKIRTAVGALHFPELRAFVPVEIFRGGAIAAGKYSILLRATFQSAERTLRDDEVAAWSARIIKALEALGGKLRA